MYETESIFLNHSALRGMLDN